jgi:hypothetical protein
MAIPQLQFLNLPQIDASIQQQKAAELQNALAPYMLQKTQMDVEKGGLEMQIYRDKVARDKLIRDELAKQYTARNGQATQAIPAQDSPTSYAAPDNPMSPRVAGPDWMPKQAPQQPQPQQMVMAQELDARAKRAAMLRSQAEIYMKNGDVTTANTLEDQAIKLEPKWNTTPHYDQSGNAFILNEQGGSKPLAGIKARDKLVSDDLGGTRILRTEYSANPVSTLQKTQTPDSIASVGATIRGQNLVDARKREELTGAESQFTPEAISNAAARYNIDGTLPPMGMGKAGTMGRSAILNKAAELAAESGVSADDQRIAQIGNKANSAALSKIQQNQTMVGAFEKNFNRNADIALEYSSKVDRTGVPIVNKWVNAGKRSVAGDPELAAFDASVKAVSNEYAKIISGSMGNTATAEGEIKKIEALLNAAQTPAQVASVITLMKRETANRMTGFEEEKTALRESMRTGKPADAAQKPAPSANPVPKTGERVDGYMFLGGDPADPARWKKVSK